MLNKIYTPNTPKQSHLETIKRLTSYLGGLVDCQTRRNMSWQEKMRLCLSPNIALQKNDGVVLCLLSGNEIALNKSVEILGVIEIVIAANFI